MLLIDIKKANFKLVFVNNLPILGGNDFPLRLLVPSKKNSSGEPVRSTIVWTYSYKIWK